MKTRIKRKLVPERHECKTICRHSCRVGTVFLVVGIIFVISIVFTRYASAQCTGDLITCDTLFNSCSCSPGMCASLSCGSCDGWMTGVCFYENPYCSETYMTDTPCHPDSGDWVNTYCYDGSYAWIMCFAEICDIKNIDCGAGECCKQDITPYCTTDCDGGGGGDPLPPTPDFSVDVIELSKAIMPGDSTSFNPVFVTPYNNYSGTVNLSVTAGCPAPASCTFSPNSITFLNDSPNPGVSRLDITNTAGVAPGTYTLTVTGNDGSLSRTDPTPPQLIVNFPGTLPKGWHDASDCTASYGWSCDQDNYAQALQVNFYRDAPFGSGGVFIGSTIANQLREPAVGAECGGNSNHGFIFPTPDSVKDGTNHSIYAYAVDIPSGTNKLLLGSPKTINCAPPLPADNSPTISISSPTNTNYANSNIPINWNATDDVGIASCRMTMDGTNIPYPVCANGANSTQLSYVHMPNITGKVLALDFAEGAGTMTYDRSGNDNNGALTNGPAWTASGKYGKALSFDGVDDYVAIANNSSLNIPANGSFTVATWVKTTDAYGHLLSFRNSAEGGAVMNLSVGFDGAVNNSGKIMALVRQNNGAGGFARVTGGTVNDGAWHYIVLTRNSTGQIELFFDGTSQGTNTGGESSGAITTNLRALGAERYWILVGFGTADQRFLQGEIDEVAVYNRVLSQTEIQNTYSDSAFNGLHSLTIRATDTIGQTGQASVDFSISSPSCIAAGSGTGLTGNYYDGTNFNTLITGNVLDSVIDFDPADIVLGTNRANGPDTFSVRWEGQVEARCTETYTFYTRTDDGVRLWVNGILIINKWVDQGPTEWSGNIALTAGQKYNIKMEYYENGGGATAQLMWGSPSTAKQIIPVTQLYPLKPAISLSPLSFNFSGVSGDPAPASQTLIISNTGPVGSVLNWTGSPNQTWCHITPSSGSVAGGSSQNVTVSVDAPSNVGTFNCAITISDPNATNSPQFINVTYVVSDKPDLVTQNLVINGSLITGDSLTFSGRVRNQGGSTAAASLARFCIDNADCLNSVTGRLGGDINVPSLGAGITSALFTSVAWLATAGNHTIYWCADVGKVVNESSEANNCSSLAFSVNTRPTANSLNATQPNYCILGPSASFSWNYSDADGDPQSAYQVQVDNNSDFSSPEDNSGKVMSGSTNYATPLGRLQYNTKYYWSLKVWDQKDLDSVPISGTSFTTPIHAYPAIDFSWSPQSPRVDEITSFFDQSTVFGGATKSGWNWIFPQGNPANSSQQNPIVKFLSVGPKAVILEVTDSDGFRCAGQKTVNVLLPVPEWIEIPPG